MRARNHSSRFIEQFGTPHNAEWPLLSFAEFASIDAQMTDDFEAYADSPHIGIDSIEQNTGKILNYRTVSGDSVKSGKYIFTRNHIIYSKIRPNLNKVAEPDFDGLCSADAYPLLAKEKVCKKRFLAIILRSDDFLSYIVPLSNRTGMPKANREQLEGYSFRMPPVDIQDAFLSIVEQADKSKFSDFKSRFIEMFRENEYQIVPLGELCKKITDGSHNPPKGIDHSQYMMISSQNVFSDALDLSDVRYLTKEDFENEDKRTSVSQGDILLTIVGTIGRVYLVSGNEGNIALQRSVAVLTPNDRITSRFLMCSFLYDDDFSKEGRGNAQKGVYLKQLSQYTLRLPSIDNQKAFEEIYKQADKSKYLN